MNLPKRIFFSIVVFFTIPIIRDTFGQQLGWTYIGYNLPETPSAATISDIAMVGDSMWITSGYGNYLNQVPGEIYFSSDRGQTFSVQTTLYGTHAIFMKDALHGWCGGVEGQIYHTDNGGATWDRLFSFGRTLLDIDFPPGCDTGICTGFNGGVKFLSLNGLFSVNMQGYVSQISSVSCIDHNHAFIAGEEIIGPIIEGNLMIDQSYPGTNGIYAIDMLNAGQGWCVGSPTAAGAWDSAGCMIIRTDDGHNWMEQVNPVKGKNGTLMAVKAWSDQEAWAVGTSGVIIHTRDGGTTWIREAEGLTDNMLYGIWVVSPQEVYVTGNNRTLLRYGPVNSVADIKKETVLVSINPNPARESFRLEYALKEPAFVDAGLYNLSGKLVKILISESQNAGLHSERYLLSGISPGIYLLKIITGNFSSSHKLIIIH